MLLKSELLDRMEILFPFQPKFSDLRRAYIDRDFASLFRLLADYHGQDADEIRKMVMEGNMHVLFRFMDGDWEPDLEHRDSKWIEHGDLRKFILEDNTWSLYRLLLDIEDTQIVQTIKSFHASGTRIDKDALSQGQLKSKMWLIDELRLIDEPLGTVFLCAGWYGILATLMFEYDLDVEKIRSFDMDPDVENIADKFNLPWFSDQWRFKAITEDIHNVDFNEHEWTAWSNKNERMSKPIKESPDTIINTSCEHIENFDDWYEKLPKGKLLVLQSNNYEDVQEHVNISKSLEEFVDQTPMKSVLYSGDLPLDTYTRYMRIGYK